MELNVSVGDYYGDAKTEETTIVKLTNLLQLFWGIILYMSTYKKQFA